MIDLYLVVFVICFDVQNDFGAIRFDSVNIVVLSNHRKLCVSLVLSTSTRWSLGGICLRDSLFSNIFLILSADLESLSYH